MLRRETKRGHAAMNPRSDIQAAYQSDWKSIASILAMAGRLAAFKLSERIAPRDATLRSDIPGEFERITAQWLDAVLCADTPGARVEDFEFGHGHVGTTARCAIRIAYNDAGREAGLPASIFAKGTPTLMTRIGMSVVPSMKAEGDFYTHVRPALDLEAPRGYHSAYDLRTGRAIHLLEDLVATRAATFPTSTTAISQRQAGEIVDLLAALHGGFFDDENPTHHIGEFPSWPTVFQRFARALNLELYHGRGFDKAAPVIPGRLRARRSELWSAIVRCVEAHHTLPQTLNHGDVHLGNWYVTGDGHMGLLDWQIVCRGHWSRDLAYAITSTLEVEQRRAWERDLIERYCDRFHHHGGARTSFEDAWRHYRQQVPSALAFWTVTYNPPALSPKNLQPPELCVEMIRRFTTAMDDLESLDAVSSL
jgi:hypothetical protein